MPVPGKICDVNVHMIFLRATMSPSLVVEYIFKPK